ncbi:MAG: TolC family protein, partial [Ignavibacteriae bacterium]|nr:TolC family protein [Ignavibacteriota bacterium]
MKKHLLIIFFILGIKLFAQNNLDFYTNKAIENNASIIKLYNQNKINKLQIDLNYAQNSDFQISLTSNYLFAPFFNNSGGLISTNPDINAIGYDAGITNGGLYSAQINVDKNIFNGAAIDALNNRQIIQEESIENNIELAKRDLIKQVTDQYLQTYLSFKLFELSSEIVANLNEQLELFAELSKNGIVKQSEYLLLSLENENQNITKNEFYTQFKVNLFQLNSLCGIADTNIVTLDSVLLKTKSVIHQSELFKKFELDSLSFQNEQQLFDTKYFPQISLFFNTGLNAVEISNIQRKFGLSAGVNFSLPIYDGNQSSISQQQNQILLESVKSFRENFKTTLNNQKISSQVRLENINNNINNLSKQMESYKTIISISEKELQQGQLSMFEYLTLLKNYTELRKNKITNEINYQLEINNYNY